MATEYRNLGAHRLRDWAHVEIEERDDIKRVTMCSRMHINKRIELTWSYDTSFSNEEILQDGNLHAMLSKTYGPDVWVGSIRI